MSDYLKRLDEAQPHRDKGYRWGYIAMGSALPHIALLPIQFAVEDAAWSAVLAAAVVVLLAFQITALVKAVRAHSRANKILGVTR